MGDWLVLQKRIFGRFVAQRLSMAGIEAKLSDDIIEDLKDGMVLKSLTEALSGIPFPGKPLKPGKFRIQQAANVDEVMNYLRKSCNIKTKASNEDILDGSEKAVLGLLFQIILKYLKLDDEEEDGGGGDVQEALLLWLKNRTSGYDGVSIDNLTKSLHDGMAFAALIHKMRPNLIDYDSLTPGQATLQLCFDLGDKYMNVEKYITPAEFVKLDNTSSVIVAYDWFLGAALLIKQDIAARRIGKLADMTKLHDELRAQYKEGAEKLVAWIDVKTNHLATDLRVIDNTMAGAKAKLDEFYTYKTEEKTHEQSNHLDLVALSNDLALRLSNANRPPFVPPAGLTLADLDGKFADLDTAEGECSAHLHAELARQVKLDKLGRRFRAEADALKGWTGEKVNQVSQHPEIDSVDDAEYHIDGHGQFSQEVANVKATRVAALHALLDQLADEKYEFTGELETIKGELAGELDGLTAAEADKKAWLDGQLAEQKQINDDLCRAFADETKAYTTWLSERKQLLNANEGVDLEQQLADVQAGINDTSDADARIASLRQADKNVQDRQITVNPYTNSTLADLTGQWSQYVLLLKKKSSLLQQQIEANKRSGMTEEQLAEVKANFGYFDKDNSGFLSRRELKSCLQSLGEEATRKIIDEIMEQYDQDKSGTIGLDEFVELMVAKQGDTNTKEEILRGWEHLGGREDIAKELIVAVVNEKTFTSAHVEYLTQEMNGEDPYDYKTWTDEAFAR